jgi:hypothetical protein
MDAACCESVAGGRIMADKDKGKLSRLHIAVAKNGFEIEANYEPKQSLSQKKGWVPSCSYCEPDKYVVNTEEALVAKIKELVKGVALSTKK